jgi:hypothetical protein
MRHLVTNTYILAETIDDLLAGRIAWTVAPPGRALDTLVLSAARQLFEYSLDADGGGGSAGRDEPVFLAHFDRLGIDAGRRHGHSILRMIGGTGPRAFSVELSGIGEWRAVIDITNLIAVPPQRAAAAR